MKSCGGVHIVVDPMTFCHYYQNVSNEKRAETDMSKPLNERIIEAEVRGSHWLAEGNEAEERGNNAKAEKCFEKSQFWLDRYNKLSGNN